MLFRKFVCGFQNNMTRFPNHEICFQNSQCVVSRQHVGLYVVSKLHGYVDSRFACFYLTGQLESIPQKLQLAGVVLMVSKPHVFNLTGQLVSKPPKFPTLAATDPRFNMGIGFFGVFSVTHKITFSRQKLRQSDTREGYCRQGGQEKRRLLPPPQAATPAPSPLPLNHHSAVSVKALPPRLPHHRRRLAATADAASLPLMRCLANATTVTGLTPRPPPPRCPPPPR